MFKLLIIFMLVAVVASLASGLVFLSKDDGKGTRTVKSLTVRIVLSFVLLGVILIGIYTGAIQPHGIGQ